ncbi:hypothetical protein [Ferrimonas lipolytica]|uniref:Uncharacterized protein n=1 Tax=Ferrimonas lipolytica TaxID=2724191 RepID=A0A6H1UAV1_9GAMM|nr:hypothetical protein [Ferrimonas lipolytica]QIZ75759.1 hypothetical protein HER31_01890 [Ferrimonas lipolytica]
MDREKVERVLRHLESAGRQGTGVISLSNAIGVSPSELRKFVSERQDFVKMIDGKVMLNRFGTAKGSVDTMLANLDKELESQDKQYYWFWLVLALSGVVLFICRT